MSNDMPTAFDESNAEQPSQAANVNDDDAWAASPLGRVVTPQAGAFGANIPLPQAQGERSPGSPYSFAPPPFWTQHPTMMAGWRVTPYVLFEAPPPAKPFPAMMGLGRGLQAWGTPAPAIVGGPSSRALGVEPPPGDRRPREPDYSPATSLPPTELNHIDDDYKTPRTTISYRSDSKHSSYNSEAQTTKSTGAGNAWRAWRAENLQVTPRPTYSRPDNWKLESSLPAAGQMTLPTAGKDGSSLKGDVGKEGTSSFRSIFGRSGLHWSLDAKERACDWNIRIPPREGLVVYPDGRNLDRIELEESAFSPPMSRARLMHPFLPWYIYVESPHSFITVIFILEFLFHDLQNPALSSDFWNDKLTEKDRNAVYSEFEKRTSGEHHLRRQGVKRIDFLRKRYVFKGLKRVGDDWKLKLNPANEVLLSRNKDL